MHALSVKRVRFCKEADTWLRMLKSRTAVTPNLLCRVGFCLSLEENGVPDPNKFPEDSDREISRYTLLGEFDAVFVCLLRQRMTRDGTSLEEIDAQFRAHMNRGAILLSGRLKSIAALSTLLPKAQALAKN